MVDLDWNALDETTAFLDPDLGPVRADVGGEHYAIGTVDPFDTSHDETFVVYRTAWGLSSAMPAPVPRDEASTLTERIPHGHTNVYCDEIRGVLIGGRVARLWPAAHGTKDRDYHLLLPADAGHRPLTVGCAHPWKWAVADALNLSARVATPLLLLRTLSSEFWH